MRVLHVSKEFQPLSSGVARHIQGLAKALQNDDEIQLTILSPDIESAEMPCRLQQSGYRSIWALIGTSELVHIHGARTPFAAAAGVLARIRGVPLIYTPHCYYDAGSRGRRMLKMLWDKTVERIIVRSAGAVVLLHEGWISDLASRGLRPARVLIIPNCIDDKQPAGGKGDRLEGAPALLSVGRLDPVKRLDDVIHSLNNPALAQAVLHIVGKGEDRTRLEALIARQGLATRVRFHGWQDDAATARMMAGCDAMVLASEREGMPTVVLEALLSGVPIACSDIEGCRSITDVVGWRQVFTVGDTAQLAECVAQTADLEVPTTVIHAVRQGFTWQRKAAELAALYKSLHKPPVFAGPTGPMGRLARYLTNYDDPRSLGSRLRARRIGPLLALIDEVYYRHGHVNLVDVGGTQRYWNMFPPGFLDARCVSITLVNVGSQKGEAKHPRFKSVVGDGCDLSEYPDKAFHIAHSNSVIEHVGDSQRVASFASELQRVAEHYFIQTPDFWCPIEPHCMTPIFHWLPRSLRVWLIRCMDLGHWPRAHSRREAEARVDSARLLTRRDLQRLLPEARIIHERVLGLPKSLIAVSS